jgi:hypothetical protein
VYFVFSAVNKSRFASDTLVGLAFGPFPPHIDAMIPALKVVVEKHSDGYVAYPLGLARGAIIGQGDTYEAALADVRSAIAFHAETFGSDSLSPKEDSPVLEAFVAEAIIPV